MTITAGDLIGTSSYAQLSENIIFKQIFKTDVGKWVSLYRHTERHHI